MGVCVKECLSYTSGQEIKCMTMLYMSECAYGSVLRTTAPVCALCAR